MGIPLVIVNIAVVFASLMAFRSLRRLRATNPRVLLTPKAVIAEMYGGRYVTWIELAGIQSWEVRTGPFGATSLQLNLATTPAPSMPAANPQALGELIDELKNNDSAAA